MNQRNKIPLLKDPTYYKYFTSILASVQYLVVNTRPDTCANVKLICPGADPLTNTEYKTLTATFSHLRETNDNGINFRPVYINASRLVLITDASFANAKGNISQLGFIVLMMDDEGHANIIHYASYHWRRVIMSVMESDIHGLAAGFGHVYVIRHLMQ